jgi:hypothetical protein
MSLVTEFARIASQVAADAIGTDEVVIGAGNPVEAVLNEIRATKDYTEAGRMVEKTLEAVVRREDWDAAGYSSTGSGLVFQKATARSETFRVLAVDVGAAFVRVALQEITKS